MDSVPVLEVDLRNEDSYGVPPELETDLESEIAAAFDLSQLPDSAPVASPEPALETDAIPTDLAPKATDDSAPESGAGDPAGDPESRRSLMILVGEIEQLFRKCLFESLHIAIRYNAVSLPPALIQIDSAQAKRPDITTGKNLCSGSESWRFSSQITPQWRVL